MRTTSLSQVVLIPRLTTYFSTVSQSRFYAQSLRVLAQVALACLVVSGMFCFPDITSGTVSAGPISKYPGRAPKGALFVVASLGLVVSPWVCVMGLGSRGFHLAHLRVRVRCGVLYLDTLSERDVGSRSMPHGFAYFGSSSERWVSSPEGQYLSSRPLLVAPGIALLSSHRLVSAGPRTPTATRPLGHSLVFPHLDARRVYLVDSFIARNPQCNAHTTSLALTLSGHTFSG